MRPLRRSPARTVVAALLLVTGLVGAACVQETDESPLASDDATTTTADSPTTTTEGDKGPESFVPEPIEWEDCVHGECARPSVPLDYSDPDGERIELYVSRSPATGDRIGALFVNPGGPGASAADFASVLATILPEEINERFDIVGVDPRGVGESSPVDCGVEAKDLYSVDPSIEDEADRVALLEVSAAYVADCAEKYGDVLPHLGTRDVALDMDSVRAAMGDDELSYLGFSYGTAIGQVYAELFPDRVRSMILDGVLELGPTGLEGAASQAVGFETALSRWVQFCRAGEGCDTADNPLGAVEAVLARSEEPGGIPAPDADRDAGPGEATLGITLALYSQSLWGSLDRALADALDGDGSALVGLADQYIGIGDFEIYFAVNCLDFVWPDDPQTVFDAAKATAQVSPHFGEALVNDYIRCVDWPVTQDPLEPVTASGAGPILVISTTGDPATPYEGGVRVADRLEEGILVTNEGDGHTVVADGKQCIDDIVVAYLIEGDTPEDGTTCS
ncbi:MAG: alpha/beta hydrolase [Acidimicrobiales bacterium]